MTRLAPGTRVIATVTNPDLDRVQVCGVVIVPELPIKGTAYAVQCDDGIVRYVPPADVVADPTGGAL